MRKQRTRLTASQKANITRWFHDGLTVKAISEKVGVTCTTVNLRIRATLMNDCAELWSKIIRQVGRCEVSGSTKDLQAHHLLEKSDFPHLRFDLSNGICLSDDIHEFNRLISPHSNSAAREAFRLWLKEHRPGQYAWWDENRLNKYTIEKATSFERLCEIYHELKAVYEKGLQNGEGHRQDIAQRSRVTTPTV